MSAPVVCTVGTSDPWNAAGIGLDARVFAAFGVRGVTVVAGVSAQDAAGIHALAAVDPATIEAQFASLASARIAAYRIGALVEVASAEPIVRRLANARVPVVYDPVQAASGGGGFVPPNVYRELFRTLASVTTLVTPNLAEARALADAPLADAATAARALVAFGARAVLVTGVERGSDLVDVLVDDATVHEFAAPRIAGELRGTGCMLAAGIAAASACGETTVRAIERARAFVRERIADGDRLGAMRVMKV